MKKKNSAKYFDYGTGSAPKFGKKKKVKKVRDRKAAGRRATETRQRNKFNKNFDYGGVGNALANNLSSLANQILQGGHLNPLPKKKSWLKW